MPYHYWRSDILLSIAASIGKTLHIDEITAKQRTFSFARVQSAVLREKSTVKNGVYIFPSQIHWTAYKTVSVSDVWNIVKKGYKGSDDPTDAADKKLFENDSKVRNALMCGLSDSELVKVMSCKTSKEIWDKLQSVHEGDKKIKDRQNCKLTGPSLRV
ncbi:hypothetical protein MRB53_030641 [Persea americana]|uniref:Uncharacterized protein n=1 Tax=Persea americana TaxID=3435 RepID=A0ACC2KMV2_PERAE|nr:hypothetical protein MRB53_030641 [Persea americana]